MSLRIKLLCECCHKVYDMPRTDEIPACRFISIPIPNGLKACTPIIFPKNGVPMKPIRHHANFFPNIVVDRLLGHGFDYINGDPERICARCGISLYDSVANAKKAWKNMKPKVQAKWNFTHILSGTIESEDGHMSTINTDGHFGFYEDAYADLNSKLITVHPL